MAKYKYAVMKNKSGKADFKFFTNDKTAKKYADRIHHKIEPIKSKKDFLSQWY